MSVQSGSKLNNLVLNWPRGTVYTSEWMSRQGVKRNLVNKYKKSHWLIPITRGAYILSGDSVDWPGGLYAIQNQLKLDIHVGGKTALQLKGLAHFLPMELKKIFLFGSSGQKLPSWFKSYDWDVEIDYIMTNLFGNNVGLSEQDYGNFSIKVSSPERAIMEVLYSVPQKQTFGEASLLMENLISLRPRVVGELLRNANSVKVKRLFLYLTEKHGHQWIKKLDLSSVDLGKGKRVIVKGGVYNPRYRITIPG